MIRKSIPKSFQKTLKDRSSFVSGLTPIFNASWIHFETSPTLILELSPARGAILHISVISTKVLKQLGKCSQKNQKSSPKTMQIRFKNRSKNEPGK